MTGLFQFQKPSHSLFSLTFSRIKYTTFYINDLFKSNQNTTKINSFKSHNLIIIFPLKFYYLVFRAHGKMNFIPSSVLYVLSLSSFFLQSSVRVVDAHGYLKSPRSRNWVAQEDGVNSPGDSNAGKPEQDFCPHCLNTKLATNLCSKGNAATLYDKWNDINGNRMPWISQGVYNEGGLMEVEAVLTTNHAGHMDM